MKKSLVMLLVIGFTLSVVGTALAFPVEFSGDFRFNFRSWVDEAGDWNNAPTFNNTNTRLRLNFSAPIDDNVTLFGRLAVSNYGGNLNDARYGLFYGPSTPFVATGPNYGDYGSEGAIDHYGVSIVNNGWTYKLGRQAVTLGQGSIINAGYEASIDNKFDGLAMSGKLGTVNTQIIAGKTTNTVGTTADWMGIDFSAPLSDTFTLGASYATEKYRDIGSYPNTKYWAVNATATPTENLMFNAEYVKSSNSEVHDYDKAYFIAGTYMWDKDSFTIQYNNVEVNAVDPFNSGIGAYLYPIWGMGLAGNYPSGGISAMWDQNDKDTKYKGMTYVYNHAMSKSADFTVVYMDLKNDVSDGDDQEYLAGVTWKF